MSIYIEDYSDKSFVVLGETREHKDNLKKLGGKWNSKLRDDKAGWIFMMKDKSTVEDYIKSGKVVEKLSTTISQSSSSSQSPSSFTQELFDEIKLLRSEISLLREEIRTFSKKSEKTQNLENIIQDDDEKPKRRLLRS